MSRYIFLLIFFFFSFSFGKGIKICYKGYYVFLPVIKNCVSYDFEKGRIDSIAFSTPIGSLFKKVEYKGYSFFSNYENKLISKYFYFIQKEGKHKWIHIYKFENDFVLFEKHHYKLENDKFVFKGLKKEKIKIPENTFDPFTASLYLYRVSFEKNSGFISIFYDGKINKVPFKVVRKSKSFIHIYLNPKFETKGLLRPSGNWNVWINTLNRLPEKMKLNFTIGSFTLETEKISNF